MLREAISNSLDAEATHISIEVKYNETKKTLDLIIADNGCGMNSHKDSPFHYRGFLTLVKARKRT